MEQWIMELAAIGNSQTETLISPKGPTCVAFCLVSAHGLPLLKKKLRQLSSSEMQLVG